MAVLCNNVIAGASIADDAAGGAYQIEKSLRFNDPDTPSLTKTFSTGNTRTWTWAAWVKRSKIGVQHNLFSAYADDNNQGYLVLESDDAIAFDQRIGGTWSNATKTTRLFRDTSAWFHITFVFDSTDATEADRIRLYINGKRETSFSDAPNCTQNLEGKYNSGIEHQIGKGQANSNHMDGYLADVQFIDGLALSPAAFGSFDSTGVWNPKAFAVPAPNDGRTWSSNISNSTTPANAVDGDLGTNSGGASNSITTFVFNPALTNVIEFDHYTNDGGVHAIAFNDGNFEWDSGGSGQWRPTIPSIPSTISKVEIQRGSGFGTDIRAVRVNGVILVDGQTDTTTRNNPNNGTTWSDKFTGGNFASGNGATLAFDGRTDTMARPDQSQTITWTAPSSIAFDKLEFCGWNDNISDGVVVNGVNISSTIAGAAAEQWTDITSLITSPLSTIVIKGDSGSNKASIRGVKINGNILVDSTVDNSFHLKFNDTSANARLGRDSFNTAISDATGALPIYNTTADSDGYDQGETKGSGYRTDSNSDYLQLAVPGDTKTDVSHSIRGSGSAKTLTQTGDVDVVTTHSRFYGSSLDFHNSDDVLRTDAGVLVPDANKKFCVEAWVYNDGGAGKVIEMASTFGAGDYFYIEVTSNGAVRGRGGSGSDVMTSNGAVPDTTWTHLAYTHDGTNGRMFVNGALFKQDTSSSANQSTLSASIGSNASSTPEEEWDGKINDLRVYFGVAKYTADFQPPTRNDFTVNNLLSYGNYPPNTTITVSGYGSDKDNILDGDTSTRAVGHNTGHGKVAFSPALTGVTKVRCYQQNYTHYLNEVAVTTPESGTGWHTLHDGNPITLNSCGNAYSPETNSIDMYAVEVNGIVVTNSGQEERLDVLNDSPTNYAPSTGDDADGGVTRGNYCTWNSLHNTNTLSQGNLTTTTTSDGNECSSGTFGFTSGKWYYELHVDTKHASGYPMIGIAESDKAVGKNLGQTNAFSFYSATGTTKSGTSYTAASVGDVIGVAVDADNGRIYYALNNTWQNSGDPTNSAATGAEQTWTAGEKTFVPWVSEHDGSKGHTNFGQRAFKYTAPSGYKCLCAQNLDDTFSGDELNNPSKYFDVLTYVGTGGNSSTEIPFKLGFGPELIWIKDCINTYSHVFTDVINTKAKTLYPDNNNAASNQDGGIKSFDSDGFKIGDSSGFNDVDDKHVAWCWDAGTTANSGDTFNQGSPSVTIGAGKQWVNPTAGFSITEFTDPNNTNHSVSHGLNAPPEFILAKGTSSAGEWICYHKSLGNNKAIIFDKDNAVVTQGGSSGADTWWNDTTPTNTLVHFGNSDQLNGRTVSMYAWTPIAGYSAFGEYTGTGDADTGQFCYTGFLPKYLLVKRYDNSAGAHWGIVDSERSPFNKANDFLYVDKTDAEADEGNYHAFDFLSNGFKPTGSYPTTNTSGGTYIWAAFAEHPFKIARAR